MIPETSIGKHNVPRFHVSQIPMAAKRAISDGTGLPAFRTKLLDFLAGH